MCFSVLCTSLHCRYIGQCFVQLWFQKIDSEATFKTMLLVCLYTSAALMLLIFVFFPPPNNVDGIIGPPVDHPVKGHLHTHNRDVSRETEELTRPLLGPATHAQPRTPTNNPNADKGGHLNRILVQNGGGAHSVATHDDLRHSLAGTRNRTISERSYVLESPPTFWDGIVLCAQSPTVILLIVVGGLMQGMSFSWQSTLPMVMDDMGASNSTGLGYV